MAAAALVLAACGSDDDTAADTAERDRPDTVGTGLCTVLGVDEIEEDTGVEVTDAEGDEGSCVWSLTESAAVIDGPNEGGDASLRASIETDAETEGLPEGTAVDGLGDGATFVSASDDAPARLVVRTGGDLLELTLANVLDGGSATETALTSLAELILDRR